MHRSWNVSEGVVGGANHEEPSGDLAWSFRGEGAMGSHMPTLAGACLVAER